MKIESEEILGWLQNEKKRIAKELDKTFNTTEVLALLDSLEVVNKAIKAVEEYAGDVEE